MGLIFLTREEREKFITYLEQDAAGTQGLVDQMDKLPGTETIAKMKRIEIAAQKIVVRMLKSTEEMSIGGS